MKHLLYFSIVFLLVACATPPVVGPELPTYTTEIERDKFSIIGVNVGSTLPEVDILKLGDTETEGSHVFEATAEGAAIGAAAGAAVGFATALILCAGGSLLCSSALELVGEGVAYGASAGATSGSTHEILNADINKKLTAEDAQISATSLDESLKELNVNNEIRDKLIRYTKGTSNYKFISLSSGIINRNTKPHSTIDAELEISVLKIVAVYLEKGRRYALGVTLNANLKDSLSGNIISDQNYRYVSEMRDAKEWISDEAKLFKAKLAESYQVLAENIVDELFYLYDFDINRDDQEAYEKFINYTLKVHQPKVGLCSGLGDACTLGGLGFKEVDTLSPKFEWDSIDDLFHRKDTKMLSHPTSYETTLPSYETTTSFIKKEPKKTTDENINKISDVTYEVRIYKAHFLDSYTQIVIIPIGIYPIPIPTNVKLHTASDKIHTKKAIRETVYNLGASLEECTKYLWTVRAHFKINNEPKVTEWAGKFPPHGAPWTLRHWREDTKFGDFSVPPSAFYYPFKTGGGACKKPSSVPSEDSSLYNFQNR